jgi:Fe-S-cluster containining protein
MKSLALSSLPMRRVGWDDDLVSIVRAYQASLARREEVYEMVRRDFPSNVHCAPSCNECCHHVFLIRLLDFFLVRLCYQESTRLLQERAYRQAMRWQLQHPVSLFVGALSDVPAIKQLEESLPVDGEACPFLTLGLGCDIYAHRPQLCRAHGYPELTMSGEMCSTCYKNLVGISPSCLEPYELPARRYLEVSDAKRELLAWLGVRHWEGFVLGVGLVLPIVMDPAAIDWSKILL